ncbi:MAG: protein-glutamate O-methyltransferase CheR [Cyanobacteria bacterium TGS_CYA1]|nr:protein-glutamate O-methyltransferase CheR [Cyanobacteria bacterium TGS_CYA1]
MSMQFTDEQIFELLQHVYQQTGFDYRDYATSSIKRRIQDAMDIERIKTLEEMSRRIFKSDEAMRKFILTLSVPTTSLFRDPEVYKCLRTRVLPKLENNPIRIWSAGCSSGEEPYSLSIMTREEGLAKHTRTYATDLNESAVEAARKGMFRLSVMQDYTSNYHLAGGTCDFSDYYTSGYGWAKFHDVLKENLVISQHNLVTDSSFNEFNLILCRNVMIYFNKALQDKVHALLFESLAPGGYLVLGDKENIRFTPFERFYKPVAPVLKIYQKSE